MQITGAVSMPDDGRFFAWLTGRDALVYAVGEAEIERDAAWAAYERLWDGDEGWMDTLQAHEDACDKLAECRAARSWDQQNGGKDG